jgi:hypothetical protein
MTQSLHLKASAISAIIEVIVTHPIDYIKTVIQNNNKKLNFNEIQILLKTPYKGVISRLYGIVPMRILFWNSLEYFKNKNYNSYQSALFTSFIQTTVDYPIEQIKTQKIINNCNSLQAFNNIKMECAISTHLIRNIGFAVCVNSMIQKDPNSLYYGAIGGFVGSIITHPFDSLKTWYQSGNKYYPMHWNINNYIKGITYRCSISLISMNVGWIIYYRLKNYNY